MLGFGETGKRPRTGRSAKKAHMEFDFAGGGAARTRRPRANPAAAWAAARESTVPEPLEEPVLVEPPPTPSNKQPQPERKPIMSNPNPAPIHAAGSIRRQSQEQRAIGSLLHGVGLALVSCILLVASLAGLGGYVLYQQMEDQSATVAMLEINTRKRMFEMESELIARNRELAKHLEQTNVRLTGLTSQLEEHRSQYDRTVAELRAANRAMERSISLYQQRTNEQQDLIAQLQNQSRIRR